MSKLLFFVLWIPLFGILSFIIGLIIVGTLGSYVPPNSSLHIIGWLAFPTFWFLFSYFKYKKMNLKEMVVYLLKPTSWIVALLIVYWVAADFLGIGGKGCVQKTHDLPGITIKLKSGGKGSIEGFGDWKPLKWGFNDSKTDVWITYMTSNGSVKHWYEVDGCDLKRNN